MLKLTPAERKARRFDKKRKSLLEMNKLLLTQENKIAFMNQQLRNLKRAVANRLPHRLRDVPPEITYPSFGPNRAARRKMQSNTAPLPQAAE